MHGFKSKLFSGGLAVCFALASVFSPIVVTAATKIQSVPNTTSIYGYDQYETAAKIAQNGWTGTSDYAILAAGMSANLIDALAAGPLAANLRAPIILTEGNVLNKSAKDELIRLQVKKVYVTSGTAVIKQSVLDEVKTIATVTEVKALGGYDASETSVNIAKAMADQGATIDKVIVTGGAGSDALSIAPIAGAQGIPILYTRGGSLSSYVLTYLDGIKENLAKTYVIGGTAVVSEAVKTQIPGSVARYFGKTQYDTNIEVLKQFAGVLMNKNTYVANGETLVDALAGAPLAVKNNSLILLTGKTLPGASKKYAQANLSSNVIGLGGESVVPANILSELSPSETISLDGASKGSADAANLEQLNGVLKVTGDNVTIKNAKTNYSIYVQGNNVTLDNITVQGTIFLDPGDNGSATLQNVDATSIVILSGADHSINFKDVTAQSLNVQSSSPNVHFNATGSTAFTHTRVAAPAIFEAGAGSSFGPMSINYSHQSTGVAPVVELRGDFPDSIEVGGGVSVIAAPGSNISNLATTTDNPNQTITLQGNFDALEVNSQGNVTLGADTTITDVVATELAKIVVPSSSSITHFDAGNTGTTPTGDGSFPGGVSNPPSDGGSSSGDRTVLVTDITVTSAATIAKGQKLKMSVDVIPTNATNKTMTWSVVPLVGGTATINAITGLLTATEVGTVTVKAVANDGSLVQGTKMITVQEKATSGATVDLGTASNFAILAKTGISTVPTSAITGNIGVSPAAASYITGFTLSADSTNVFSTSTQVIGKAYAADYTSPTPSNLTTAISNMETAYSDAAGRAADYTELSAGDISGLTLTAGVYKWGTGVSINEDVTLDGSADDVWIFQIAQGITQASAKNIILTGEAQAKNIFWQAAETVAIGTDAHFEGIILGQTNISLGTNASINGRLLAQTAVTLEASTVVAPDAGSAPEAVSAITSPEFETVVGNNTVTITLTGGTFKAGTIVADDFTFDGTDKAVLMAATTFTRTSDTAVTVTGLVVLTGGADNTVLVKAVTQATQATAVAAVASTD